ncbi:hypothetical protein HGRIS_005346 [Hohenbuehelia grisea]|uniref:FAD dependent oxidoreductase domain-containing protein n=1 Tax=Hohenbuehelia grisea TaxID=104357 RepID=A0ABR3JFT4_9AGAR
MLAQPALNIPLNQFEHTQRVFESPHEVPKPSTLPVPNPTRSFWLDTPGANPLARQGSEGLLSDDADVCIIGSGITGVSTAYHLAEGLKLQEEAGGEPLKVVILEARDFCSGATGRNGGHFAPHRFLDFRAFSDAHGIEEALRSYALEKRNVEDLLSIIDQQNLSSSIDLIAGGRNTLFFTEVEEQAARADFSAAERAGLDLGDVEWFTAEEMQKTYGTPYSGVRYPAHNLWPLKLVTHIFNMAQQAMPHLNLTLHTHTPVTFVDPLSVPHQSNISARRWSLNTPRGRISCSQVVHATNAYASALLPTLAGPSGIVPTRGQVIAVRAKPGTGSRIGIASWLGNEGFEYWFPRPPEAAKENAQDNNIEVEEDKDGALVILGGGREASGPTFEFGVADDSQVHLGVSDVLRGFLPRVFPGLYEEREPDMEWTGIMGFTKTHDPFVGPFIARSDFGVQSQSEPRGSLLGQYIVAGFSGHGMTRTFLCAEAIAQMLVAERKGSEWHAPEWFPRRYLTSRRKQ